MKVLTSFLKLFPVAHRRNHLPLKWIALHLKEQSLIDLPTLYKNLLTSEEGLSHSAVTMNRKRWGFNEGVAEVHPVFWRYLFRPFYNPFILLLGALAAVSLVTGDLWAATILVVMILASVLLRFFQEFRAALSIERLSKKVTTYTSVLRNGNDGEDRKQQEIPIREVVPGDIVFLSAGDMVPADMRLICCKDLFVSQQILTGESLPSEKTDAVLEFSEKPVSAKKMADPVADLTNICFRATNVVSGTGMGVVIATGRRTIFGSIAQLSVSKRSATAFDNGISDVSWLLVRFVAILLPLVLFLNGFTKGDWSQAFFFAISVVVGLTPEMLPMIVAANLARGAINLSSEKVIVKHLHSVQNLGAIDVLCTDKTGTLTQNQIVLEKHFDVDGEPDDEIWRLAYLNSFYQTGLKNLLDEAILKYIPANDKNFVPPEGLFLKVDEIPFDFTRRRMSVIVENKTTRGHLLITKGASEEILSLCSHLQIGDEIYPLDDDLRRRTVRLKDEMGSEGMRILAVAFKRFSPITKRTYSSSDEVDMVMSGYVAFLDPPKSSAEEAIAGLKAHGVAIKILTGDNEMVTRKICDWLHLAIEGTMLGTEVDDMNDAELGMAVERINLFAKLTPSHKARIIRALQANNHVVGYIGDGINDALALRDADVGISVDAAADIARESADVVLANKDLTVLERAIIEGRTAFGNTIKFIKTTASSNFGNIFSVVAASIFLPFLPMLPLQFLTQNLIYDFSQTTIPLDKMDDDYELQPRRWNSRGIAWFMLIFGPLSSIFDFFMFFILWFYYGANCGEKAAFFQTGWFIQGLVTQTLIVLVLRTRFNPILKSWPAAALLLSIMLAVLAAAMIPYTALGTQLHMVSLPASYFAWLTLIMLAYAFLTQGMKQWYLQRFGDWL